jgi:hypothetical protein
VTESFKKSYQHLEAPNGDCQLPYNNEQLNEAFETYVEDTFDKLKIADAQDTQHTWGPLTLGEMDKINHPGYITNDKEHLKAEEEKQQAREAKMKAREAARKNRTKIAKLQ